MAKDTVMFKALGGSFTNESVVKMDKPDFKPELSSVPMVFKSSSPVVMVDEGTGASTITTLEKAWCAELSASSEPVALWSLLQRDVTAADEPAEKPCTISMKAPVIFVPSANDHAMRRMLLCRWAPKKNARWLSVWGKMNGQFLPMHGLWLVSTKGINFPGEVI